MIKLTRGVTERVVLLSLFLKERGYDLVTVLEEAIRYKSSFKKETTLRDIYAEGLRHEGIVQNWDALLQYLKDELDAASPITSHHPALIDLLVDTLQSPYCRNVLAGKTLNQLRKAMLFPEEMSKVGESIQKEKSCGNCGKTFCERELAVATQTENGGMVFYCAHCANPVFSACQAAGCDNSGEIDGKIMAKLLGKCDCGQHNKANLPLPNVANWVDVGQPLGGLQADVAAAPADPRMVAREIERARARRAGQDRW